MKVKSNLESGAEDGRPNSPGPASDSKPSLNYFDFRAAFFSLSGFFLTGGASPIQPQPQPFFLSAMGSPPFRLSV